MATFKVEITYEVTAPTPIEAYHTIVDQIKKIVVINGANRYITETRSTISEKKV